MSLPFVPNAPVLICTNTFPSRPCSGLITDRQYARGEGGRERGAGGGALEVRCAWREGERRGGGGEGGGGGGGGGGGSGRRAGEEGGALEGGREGEERERRFDER